MPKTEPEEPGQHLGPFPGFASRLKPVAKDYDLQKKRAKEEADAKAASEPVSTT